MFTKPVPVAAKPTGTETITVTTTATETITTTTTVTTTGDAITIQDLSPEAWYKLYKVLAVAKYVTDNRWPIEDYYPL